MRPDTLSQTNHDSLTALSTLKETIFHHVLTDLLHAADLSIADLYDYLWQEEFCITIGALYRYFNGSRFPRGGDGYRFINLFGDFLGLDESDQHALVFLWELKRMGLVA